MLAHCLASRIRSSQLISAMANLLRLALLTVGLLSGFGSAVDPEEVYDGGLGKADVLLNIGNGGAGQSGLVKGAKRA